ncbi:hypothetical protein D5086_033724 [Populus alba]|uniref:Uncharacterized protein n=1 Tax=Populus alba TaxID=43335 RepID=A0ACC4AHJ7_POPAL
MYTDDFAGAFCIRSHQNGAMQEVGQSLDSELAYCYHAMKLAILIAPACFNVPQRQATADAGKIAGLMSCISLMSPLLLQWLMILKRGQLLLLRGMFDLGGGTFDEFWKRNKEKDSSGNAMALKRLSSACERMKRSLSSSTQANIEMDLKLVDKCLRDAKMDKSSINDIVLIGGSNRIPMVQHLLQYFFIGKDLYKNINPDEAVAYGVAVLSAKGDARRLGLNVDLVK